MAQERAAVRDIRRGSGLAKLKVMNMIGATSALAHQWRLGHVEFLTRQKEGKIQHEPARIRITRAARWQPQNG